MVSFNIVGGIFRSRRIEAVEIVHGNVHSARRYVPLFIPVYQLVS